MPVREQPIQDYYPSARVRLIVRFEDYGAEGTPTPPVEPPQLRQGTASKSTLALEVVEQSDGSLLLVAPGDDPNQLGSPQEQHASIDGYTHVIDGIIPTNAQLARNGIRTADTLSLDLKFRDLPIDPRTVRSCAVEYFLGCVSSEDYERGIAGELRSEGVQLVGGIPYNVIPDTYLDTYGRQRTNLRFQGWVDLWEDDWPDGDGASISLQCTDNTRLLLDQDHAPKLGVSVDLPLDQAIAQYLANYPQFRGLKVEYRPVGSPRPVMKDVLTKEAYPLGVGPSAATGGDSKLTVWDYLTDVVGSVGLTVRMDGVTVVVQRARTLYADKFLGRTDDPFRGRVLPSGRVLQRRLMVYGHNVADMHARRDFSKYSPTNVEVRCYNPRRKKTLIARYPTFVSSKQKKLLPGESAEQKYTVVRVTGIEDEKTLRVIAQTSYETIGRRELEFTITTKNLASFGGGNTDPDLLDALEGDSVDIEIQQARPDEELNTTNLIEEQLRTRPEAYLRELGFPDGFAKGYAQALSHVAFPVTFRIRSLDLDWDSESEGVVVTLNAINYVEIRADAELPEGEEIQPEPTTETPPQVVVQDL